MQVKNTRVDKAKSRGRHKFVKYLGVVICPNCGKRGYNSISEEISPKTGKNICTYSSVQHSHKSKDSSGKWLTILDKECYLGLVSVRKNSSDENTREKKVNEEEKK